jgi:hypothetical protein
MTGKQEVKLNMYNAVLRHGDTNSRLVETIPALQEALGAFRNIVADIAGIVSTQLASNKGYSRSKATGKTALCTFANRIAGALHAWATDQKDEVLMEKTKKTFSDFARLRDEELAPGCRYYYDLAAANEANLSHYGVSNTVIAAFKTDIDSYDSTVSGPRNAIASKTVYRKNLEALFRKADLLLKGKIDKLTWGISSAEQMYLDGYKANRMIVDAGGTTTQLSITVTDEESNSPLKDAIVKVEETNTAVPTDKEGNSRIKPVRPGQYRITIQKAGFQPATLDEVKVMLGRVNTLTATLKRE